jgi:hypothetical protein
MLISEVGTSIKRVLHTTINNISPIHFLATSVAVFYISLALTRGKHIPP